MTKLVDLQINGYLGVDFSSSALSDEGFADACRKIIGHGISVFCPTLITSSVDLYKRNLPIIARVIGRDEFKTHVPGIHLEGPFISALPGFIGAHNPEWVKEPSVDFFDRLLEWAEGKVSILTLAAEAIGAADLATHAVRHNVAVFLGHQNAGTDDLRRLADVGAIALTHLGNGMPNQVHRHDNSLMHGLAIDELSATIITDGHHLPDHLIKTIINVKGTDRVAIVSDASPLAGMPPGDYSTLGNPVRLEESGLLHNPEKGVLVGSSSTLIESKRYLESLNLLTPEQVRKVVYENPLRLIQKRGSEGS